MQTNNQFRRIFFVILIFSLFPFLSCKKYLDKKPDSSLTVPQTLDELQNLFNDADRMNFNLTPSLGETSADDYFLNQSTYDRLPDFMKNGYNWTIKDYKFGNDWSTNYLPVYNANYTLETLKKIVKTVSNEDQWDKVKGYALFTRGYSFLNLTWDYAKAYDETTAATDLGIALRTTADFNVPSKRANVEATYQQIIADAEDASSLLPDLSSNVLLPSKAAAYGLLARTFLSMGKFDSALNYSTLCLNLKSDLMDYNNVSLTNNVPFTNLDNLEIIYDTEMNTFNTQPYSFSGFVDTTLYSMYNDSDLRKTIYFRLDNGYYRFKGPYTANGLYLFTGIATDEIFLIRAECYARLGDIENAMKDLNILMVKRWKNTVPYPIISTTNQADAIKKILIERRKELLMRGIRWSDIKRLNKESENIVPTRIINGKTFTLPPNDNRYALPLPIDIITSTGMPQNE